MNKIKGHALRAVTVVHVHIHKKHFRRGLMITIVICAGVHFTVPELEWLAAMILNIAFYYDPVIPDEANDNKKAEKKDIAA